MHRAQRCLVPGRAGICPQQPDSGPTPAPGHLLPPPGWKRGIAPHKPRVSCRLPTLQAWARGAVRHTRRYSGFASLCLGFAGVSGARQQFLCVLTPQTGSKQHERNQRENDGRSWTSKTPSAPIGFNIKKPPRSLRHCIN